MCNLPLQQGSLAPTTRRPTHVQQITAINTDAHLAGFQALHFDPTRQDSLSPFLPLKAMPGLSRAREFRASQSGWHCSASFSLTGCAQGYP